MSKAKIKTKSAKAAKKPTTAKAKAGKPPKGPGVIDTIVEVLKASGGTVAEITGKVAKKFPDRKTEQLTSTVRAQMNRLKLPF
jgi:hypothetical protein